jgi:hypothetical protein
MKKVLAITAAIMISFVSLAHAQKDFKLPGDYNTIVPVKGGTSFNNAVDIKPGRYKLGEALKANEYSYFKIKIVSGERLVCRVRTIGPNDEGGIAIYSTQEQMISSADTTGADTQQSCLFDLYDMTGSVGSMYIVIGSQLPSTVNAIYDVVVYDHSGWFSAKDASNEFNAALEITPGVQEFLSYAPDNMVDMYVMKLKSGEDATIVLKPGQAQGYFRVTVFDGKFQKIKSDKNMQPGASMTLTTANTGTDERIYIKVDRDGQGDPAGEYTIKVDVK